jgi:hypothetical protein
MLTKILKFARSSINSTSLLFFVVFSIAIVCSGCVVRPSVVSPTKPTGQQAKQPVAQALQAIRKYVEAQTFHSEAERIDFIRNWVYQNSIHLIDKEHDRYAFNTAKVLPMLWHTHLTGQAPAHLSCGPRAAAMQAILKELGIPSQMIFIFTDNYAQVQSHTFLEVFNRETSKWELQDPDFNLYYVNLQTQARVATADLIWGDLDVIVPRSPTAQGWAENNVEILKRDYFEAMMYVNDRKDAKSLILVNLDRFQPEKVFSNNADLTFYGFANKYYRIPFFFKMNEGLSGG